MTAYPDYTVWFRGFPCCPCLAKWLLAYEHEIQRRGFKGSLHIYQLIGFFGGSANTHSKGGAFDLAYMGEMPLWVARQMGAPATWHRLAGWDGGGGIDHQHGVLRGCPHNGPAAYQIPAVDAGYNGLGHLGEGGKDTGPRPVPKRTWQQGIAWAKQQEEEDMALSDEDKEWLVKQINKAVADGLKVKLANDRTLRQTVYLIAKKVGVQAKEPKDE